MADPSSVLGAATNPWHRNPSPPGSGHDRHRTVLDVKRDVLVVALPGGPRSPAAARRIAAVWRKAAACPQTADAVLIVSELVTNAVSHTRGPCLLTLAERGGSLDIAVSDHSEDMPDVHRPAEGGPRGGFDLEIMRHLGDSLRVVPRIGGKTIHVALRGRAPVPDRRRPP
ncbi:ATP-binding protein [Streptomyces hydrogenans]|uniref:ATP-binding protein n=1 Tax=Streptomyces hydrogenans TaxID=1873719 RepID=UPI003D7339D2